LLQERRLCRLVLLLVDRIRVVELLQRGDLLDWVIAFRGSLHRRRLEKVLRGYVPARGDPPVVVAPPRLVVVQVIVMFPRVALAQHRFIKDNERPSAGAGDALVEVSLELDADEVTLRELPDGELVQLVVDFVLAAGDDGDPVVHVDREAEAAREEPRFQAVRQRARGRLLFPRDEREDVADLVLGRAVNLMRTREQTRREGGRGGGGKNNAGEREREHVGLRSEDEAIGRSTARIVAFESAFESASEGNLTRGDHLGADSTPASIARARARSSSARGASRSLRDRVRTTHRVHGPLSVAGGVAHDPRGPGGIPLVHETDVQPAPHSNDGILISFSPPAHGEARS